MREKGWEGDVRGIPEIGGRKKESRGRGGTNEVGEVHVYYIKLCYVEHKYN